MNNQRAGKFKPAAMDNGMHAMRLRDFFRNCKELLEEDGQEDAAFYFEQIMEELNEGRTLPGERPAVSRVLGL